MGYTIYVINSPKNVMVCLYSFVFGAKKSSFLLLTALLGVPPDQTSVLSRPICVYLITDFLNE